MKLNKLVIEVDTIFGSVGNGLFEHSQVKAGIHLDHIGGVGIEFVKGEVRVIMCPPVAGSREIKTAEEFLWCGNVMGTLWSGHSWQLNARHGCGVEGVKAGLVGVVARSKRVERPREGNVRAWFWRVEHGQSGGGGRGEGGWWWWCGEFGGGGWMTSWQAEGR